MKPNIVFLDEYTLVLYPESGLRELLEANYRKPME